MKNLYPSFFRFRTKYLLTRYVAIFIVLGAEFLVPSRAKAAVSDCIEDGGQAVCSIPVPTPWNYGFCDPHMNFTYQYAAFCRAQGGTWMGEYASPDCTGTFPLDESNLVTVAASYSGKNIDQDSGWGQTVSDYNCWSGSPRYQGDILIGDFRTLSNSNVFMFVEKARSLQCPVGSVLRTVNGHTACVRPVEPMQCGVGNPVTPATGTKIQIEQDDIVFGEPFERYYNPFGSLIPYTAGMNVAKQFGDNWRSIFDYKLYPISDSSYSIAAVSKPDGSLQYFNQLGRPLLGYGASDESLIRNSDNYIYSADNRKYIFDIAGKLISIKLVGGVTRTLTYSNGTTGAGGGYVLYPDGTPSNVVLPAGLLLSVTDSFGRTMTFGYDAINRVVDLVDSEGKTIKYSYGVSDNLISVTYADNKTRTYVYNESPNISGANLPHALTGIVDENGNRFATYKYDNLGRAISTEHDVWIQGNPDPSPVEKVSLIYTADSSGAPFSSNVTDALGTTRTYSFTNILGVVKNTGVTQPCNAGCGAASATSYDANGNVSSRTDFNGNVTNYVYDLSRNLETSRTEAYGTPQARTITTQWHPTYRLPTLITEPGKTTTFNYDASGNLLSKTITDTALNQSRTWGWTYNALGQVLTADGPRTDVNDVTTYTYYTSASNAAGSVHAIGDLATVTNAVGLVTSITNYDLNGRPLSIIDPNNVVTTLTYWPRGWLHTRTVNGTQTTTYDYDGVGQLTQVTLPDNSALQYTYDTAHRLTDIQDGYMVGGTLTLSGNKIHYTLDAMGNRTQEDTKDPSNNILKTRSRIFDALNRLQKDIGGTSPSTQITQYTYDDNGNLKTITDPLNHITVNGYDALNRLITVTDPANGVSTTNYNALDQITSVSDPRLVTTNYTINALGDVTLTQSPDSGNTNKVYDAAGNIVQKTDARGVVSNYAYDALNRLKKITYPSDSTATLTFKYDNFYPYYFPNNNGYLSSILSPDGSSMDFYRDAYGNLTGFEDVNSVGDFYSEFHFDSANRLIQIIYNNARIVTYTRNALGQIVQVQMQKNSGAAVQTIVSNVTYEPFGPIKSITYGNGITTTFAHDQDYHVNRVTTTSTPAWDYVYSYDAASRLTGMADQIGALNKSYDYDTLDRLTSDQFDGSASLSYTYQYDAGGNRLQRGSSFNSHPLSTFVQRYASASNRQTGLGLVSTPSDAGGNLTVDSSGDVLTYNTANRLVQTSNSNGATTYQYNALGWRNLKQQGSILTHYDYLPDGKLLEQTQPNADGTWHQTVDYIWLDDMPIAQIKTTYGYYNHPSTKRLTYIHADHLNTPRLMTDDTQKVVWQWTSDGYGYTPPDTDPDGDGITDTLDLRFPGQIADSETGLFYNMNRYYDPITGRYTQSDPIGVTRNYSDPMLRVLIKNGLLAERGIGFYGLNQPYAYADENPLIYTDSSGLVVTKFPGQKKKDVPDDDTDNPRPKFPKPSRMCSVACTVTYQKGVMDCAQSCSIKLFGYNMRSCQQSWSTWLTNCQVNCATN